MLYIFISITKFLFFFPDGSQDHHLCGRLVFPIHQLELLIERIVNDINEFHLTFINEVSVGFFFSFIFCVTLFFSFILCNIILLFFFSFISHVTLFFSFILCNFFFFFSFIFHVTLFYLFLTVFEDDGYGRYEII